MDTVEEAQNFLTECEGMIQGLQVDSEGLFNTFEGLFGRVTDKASFLSFYQRFLQSCPNPKIAEGHDTEEEANKVWDFIDVNHNNLLDSEETKNLVEATIRKAMDLTRIFFKMDA